MFMNWISARCTAARISLLVIALVMCGSRAWAAPGDASPRVDRPIDAGWKFIRSDMAGAQAVGFDDSSWQQVDLPHTWNVADGGQGNYYRGPGWYRLHLNIGPDLAGKNLFLRFGAASLVAQVYVNGQEAGVHKGGFAAFCFDISKLAHAGDNIVAVRVTNANDPNVSPLSGDFTIYGGLYREVHLLALDPVSISPVDDASPGVYLKTAVTEAAGNVDLTVKLRNGGERESAVRVICTVLDASGKSVQETTINQTVPAGAAADAVGKFTIDHPHLWNGTSDPYVYRVEIDVKEGDRLLDHVEQPLGFRYFKIDPDQGLILNGKPYDMHGVNIHQGRPSVGFANTAEMMEEDYKIVHDLGCTGVRMAHYQHADYEHTLCDKYGIIVWSELALVNRMTDSPEFKENVKQQLREMIKQAGNHPSIFLWSMYNEPAVNARSGTQEQWHLVADLVAEAHELDPTRLTTGAAEGGLSGPILWYMDVTGMNRYSGWYGGSPAQWGMEITRIRTQNPGKSIGISEYGAGASVFQHETHPIQPATGGHLHPEEWESIVHEAAWQAMGDKQWLWCKLVWCMFDFGSAGRHEGDRDGINDKGLVTADRKVLKDAYFYYKACWNPEPMVYITDRRFSQRPVGPADIKIYSNCDSVELWMNGKSMGAKKSPSHIFVWPAMQLPDGSMDVRATTASGGKEISDAITWAVSAATTEPSAAVTGRGAR